MNTKEEIIAFGYKVFILLIITSQIYSIAFQEINTFTLTMNILLGLYFAFRFYLLIKLAKDAVKYQIPFPEFLKMRCSGCCEKCKCKLKSDSFQITND